MNGWTEKDGAGCFSCMICDFFPFFSFNLSICYPCFFVLLTGGFRGGTRTRRTRTYRIEPGVLSTLPTTPRKSCYILFVRYPYLVSVYPYSAMDRVCIGSHAYSLIIHTLCLHILLPRRDILAWCIKFCKGFCFLLCLPIVGRDLANTIPIVSPSTYSMWVSSLELSICLLTVCLGTMSKVGLDHLLPSVYLLLDSFPCSLLPACLPACLHGSFPQ